MSSEKESQNEEVVRTIEGVFTKPCLLRLRARAGITRSKATIFPAIREIIDEKLTKMVDTIAYIIEYTKSKTVKDHHVRTAAKILGVNLVASQPKTESILKTPAGTGEKKAKSGAVAKRMVRRLQRSSGLLTQYKPFRDLLKQRFAEHVSVRIGVEAVRLILLYLEDYVIRLYTAANLVLAKDNMTANLHSINAAKAILDM